MNTSLSYRFQPANTAETANSTPTLSFKGNRWVLTSCTNTGLLANIIICYSPAFGSEYKFVYTTMAGCEPSIEVEVVSESEYWERYAAVLHNEGPDEAESWSVSGVCVSNISSSNAKLAYARCAELVKHWEAMLTLGLFTPRITLL